MFPHREDKLDVSFSERVYVCARRIALRILERSNRINRAIFDHRVDVGSVRDVVQRIRIENDEIGEIAVFDLTDMSADFAAKKFRCVSGSALKNLHRRQARFLHQLKFAEKRGAMNRADVSRISACRDGDVGVF